MACNLVCGPRSVSASHSEQILIDRTSLSKDPNTHESQLYAQLAHSIVNFLGLDSPQDLAEFGLNGVSDLVDLISRVRSALRDHYSFTYGYFLVYDQHLHSFYTLPGPSGLLCITCRCADKPLLRSERRGSFPSGRNDKGR